MKIGYAYGNIMHRGAEMTTFLLDTSYGSHALDISLYVIYETTLTL